MAMAIEDSVRTEMEAAAFRRLVEHLRHRTDVQNVDLMGVGGFCRNCLGDWLQEAGAARGVTLGKDEARALVYGMDPGDWKEKYQTPATDAQMRRMDESVAKNAH
ncbi:DUF1244 domain-containing protein [Sphingosinicella sp.]|uniref:DUF1244 domain-containing protein n=1 Tax=Sphingosinicella sp. TaxID=1917971 RepID=UPI0025F7EF20|nr:DUF1244 domain-containing protein [Sphingosinicella sp.]